MIEPKILLLPLSKIRRDGGTQSRAHLDSQTAALYSEAIRAGSRFPEIVVFFGRDDRPAPLTSGDHYWMASGFHRCEAYEQAGRSHVDCKVYAGTVRDAILFSVGANERHGLQRTNEDKRHAVSLLLSDAEWSRRSNCWIAEKCHVSTALVLKVRDELAEDAAHQDRIRFAHRAGGQTYPVQILNIGKKKADSIIRPETDPEALETVIQRIDRSIPKAVRQAKTAGWSWDEFLDVCRECWAKYETQPVEAIA